MKRAALEDAISEQQGHQAHSRVASPEKLSLWLCSTLQYPCYDPPQDVTICIFLFLPLGRRVFRLSVFLPSPLYVYVLVSPAPGSVYNGGSMHLFQYRAQSGKKLREDEERSLIFLISHQKRKIK